MQFKVNNQTQFVDVRKIRCTKYSGNFENTQICGCFVNQDDKLLYFLNNGEKTFWLEECYIPRDIIQKYMSDWSKSSTENVAANDTCRIRKDNDIPCLKKTRTKGMFLLVFNCGIIGSFKEIFGSESLSQVSSCLLEIIEELPKYIIYDDACHLDPYIKKHNK